MFVSSEIFWYFLINNCIYEFVKWSEFNPHEASPPFQHLRHILADLLTWVSIIFLVLTFTQQNVVYFFFSFFFFDLTSDTFSLIMQFFKEWKSLIQNGSILECGIFPLDVFSVILMQRDTWNMILVCIHHSTNIFSFFHFVFCLNLLLFHFRTDRKHLAWMIYRQYNVWIHFDHYFCIHITVGSFLTL